MPADGSSRTAQQDVDVDWNKRSAGEDSGMATENAVRWRDATRGLPVCDPTAVSDFCEKLRGNRIAAQAKAQQIAIVRDKQDAGSKLTARESAILIRADAEAATARMAAQEARAQAALQQATYALQRQADELADRQRLAACTAAADLVALSIRSFWGGIVAGVATGASCMN
jgi:hypothetical protein